MCYSSNKYTCICVYVAQQFICLFVYTVTHPIIHEEYERKNERIGFFFLLSATPSWQTFRRFLERTIRISYVCLLLVCHVARNLFCSLKHLQASQSVVVVFLMCVILIIPSVCLYICVPTSRSSLAEPKKHHMKT